MRKSNATPAIVGCLFVGACIVIIGTSLHGCIRELNKEQKELDDKIAEVKVDVDKSYDEAVAVINDDIIERVMINGHYHLIVSRWNRYHYSYHRAAFPVKEIVASLGHDPDCPCHKK